MTMNQKDLLIIYLQLQNEYLCSDFHQILFQDILIKLNIIDNVDKTSISRGLKLINSDPKQYFSNVCYNDQENVFLLNICGRG